MAQALTESALSPPTVQQPQGSVKGLYTAARVSPLSGVAKLVEAVMARKAMDQSNLGMAQMYAQGLQTFNPGGAPAAAPADPGAQGGYSGGAGAADAGQPGSTTQRVNPMNPTGMPSQPLMRLYMTDPAKYLEAIKGTPEWQTALAAYRDPQKAMAALQAEYAKKGAMEMRAGGETGIPDATAPGGYRWVRTPNVSPNQDYTRNPDGTIAETHNIPGALDAIAQMKGTEAGANFANTAHEMPMGGGVSRFGYGQDLLGTPPALRGPQAPQMPALPSIGQPGRAIAAQGASPAVPASPVRQYFPPTPPPIFAGPTPGVRNPGDLPQRDSNGTTFSGNLWPEIPKMVIPQTPGQTSNAYQQAIIGGAAKKHQELVDEFGKQSAAGVQQLEYLTAAEKALPKAEVGPMSEWLTAHRGKLIELAPSLAPILGGSGTVTPTLELNKQLTNAALQGARSTFGTRMTQNEVKLQTEEMSPSVGMTRDALTSLIHQAKMKAAYAIQQDKDYSEYHAANGDPNRFESQYNVRRPITRFAAQYDTPQAALDRLKHQPNILPDFKAKYGWDPTQ